MEIRPIPGAKYASESTGKGQESKEKTAKKSTSEIVTDYVKISREAREQVESKKTERFDRDWIHEQMESARAEADAMDKKMKTMSKCMKIVANIMSGNLVPNEDMQYLLENDSKGYQMAMAMRKVKPDPKEEDRVTEDEEEASGGAEATSAPEGGGAPSGEAPAPEIEAAPVE